MRALFPTLEKKHSSISKTDIECNYEELQKNERKKKCPKR